MPTVFSSTNVYDRNLRDNVPAAYEDVNKFFLYRDYLCLVDGAKV